MECKSIEIVPYDADWPRIFEHEAAAIREQLDGNCVEIHHVGSTAVLGLSAKPIIDMVLVAKNPSEAICLLESLGYVYEGEMNIPFRFYFNKKSTIEFHLHVYSPDSPEVELNLLFRNFLRSHPDACNEYADLKRTLAEEQKAYKDIRPMLSHYTLGKNIFIRNILQQAGFDRLRLMHCTHYAEWEAAKIFRQKYFFDKVPIADPYTWTFKHKDHVHFVLYKGVEIVGYVHLQYWPEKRVAMRIIVIDENFRGQGFGEHLLGLCEKWLRLHGVKSIHIQTSPESYNFYKKNAYAETPFNDPDEHAVYHQDIDMGKLL